ncbi:MAG: 3-keto-5-aminohexanoate cleavage protein [Proteobacteria bacterium]|nr:3-keto-5-aminohexanoate cleavage protein [Pseudomonadota bacterium]HQR03938.1 3-keto-5-aminohexanoate cleavage protein [Rhodocyclaceae bacterium]
MEAVPLIIEAALNGSTSKARNPYVPITPDEVAAAAVAAYDAGAAIIHTHPSSLSLTGRLAADEYLAAWHVIKAQRPGAILYGTATLAPAIEERCAHTALLAESGLAAMGYIDPGSTNLATSGENGMPGAMQWAYANTYAEIDYMLRQMQTCRLGPSIAVYEPGFLRTVLAYHRADRLPPGALIKFYFGGDHNYFDGVRGGITFGLPPTPTALAAYLEMMAGCDLPWAVTVAGGDGMENGIIRRAIELGGHVRVGLEDFAGERHPTNAQLAAEVAALARSMGRPVADGRAAARILGLPRA